MGVDYLVTGAAGMIGSQITYGHKLGRADLDITSPEQTAAVFDRIQPKAVIHLAALNLQQCARDPALANHINVYGTEVVARACADRGIRLVYVSSGAVFFGPFGQSFAENDEPHPRHIYGKTKLEAERRIREIVSDHLIVRTGWVFGERGAHRRKLVDIVLHAIATRQPVRTHAAQTGSPTSVFDFCGELRRMTDSPRKGVVHSANQGIATPSDIATFVLARYAAEDLLVVPSSGGLGPDRSPSEVLTSSVATLRPWQEALQAYLEEKEAMNRGQNA